jgi:hypothetical protein
MEVKEGAQLEEKPQAKEVDPGPAEAPQASAGLTANQVFRTEDFQQILRALSENPGSVMYASIHGNPFLKEVFGLTPFAKWAEILKLSAYHYGLTEKSFAGWSVVPNPRANPPVTQYLSTLTVNKPPITLFITAGELLKRYSTEDGFTLHKTPPPKRQNQLFAYAITLRVAQLLTVCDFARRGASVGREIIEDPILLSYPQDTGHGWKGNPVNPFILLRNMEKSTDLIGMGLYEALVKVESGFFGSQGQKHLSAVWVPMTDGAATSQTSLRRARDVVTAWQCMRAVEPPAVDAKADSKGTASPYLSGLQEQQQKIAADKKANDVLIAARETARLAAMKASSDTLNKTLEKSSTQASEARVQAALISATAQNPTPERTQATEAVVDFMCNRYRPDPTIPAENRSGARVKSFLSQFDVYDPTTLDAVVTRSVSLERLLEWASYRNKKYFTRMMVASGITNMAILGDLYDACHRAINANATEFANAQAQEK